MLYIYAPQNSTRLQYIAYVLFEQLLEVDFQIITNKQTYLDHPSAKINYSNESLLPREIQIPNSDLLRKNDIVPLALSANKFMNLPILFSIPTPTATLPFDFFSMAFFLLSRYEEYLPFTADAHGRFPAKISVAARHQFLQLPIIELWLEKLIAILKAQYPNLRFTSPTFRFLPTYDIDLAWAYRQRSWWRMLGSGLQNAVRRKWQLVKQQQDVLWGRKVDPFATFAELDRLHQQFSLNPVYFFLLADYAKYDKNIKPTNSALQLLIKTLHKQYQIGIHPSYQSNSSFKKLTLEVERLTQLIDQSVQHSRQHFLKLHLPDTYQDLLRLDITNDYSMGYADQIGFRAGISRPYFWYDLRKEKMTSLLVHPFCMMDVTLQQYLQLTPAEAVTSACVLIQQLQQVGGTFSTIWHNSSFSPAHGWAGWQSAYQQIVVTATGQISK